MEIIRESTIEQEDYELLEIDFAFNSMAELKAVFNCLREMDDQFGGLPMISDIADRMQLVIE